MNGIKVKSGIKAGRLAGNHNRALINARSGIKAGKLAGNHNRSLIR